MTKTDLLILKSNSSFSVSSSFGIAVLEASGILVYYVKTYGGE